MAILSSITDALWSMPNPSVTGNAATTLIEVPVQLKRCGMAVRLIVRAPGNVVARGPDPKMVALISKAQNWFERLASGRCASINTLAKQEKVSGSYVTRLIYLAFLDPGIVQRILKGDHPEELNAERLMRIGPLPTSWNEQRALLGLND